MTQPLNNRRWSSQRSTSKVSSKGWSCQLWTPTSCWWRYSGTSGIASMTWMGHYSNKHWAKMSLAIHEANSRKISLKEYKKITKATEIIVKKLNQNVNSDPCAVLHVSTPKTKMLFVKWFLDEFNQAILNLGAQKTILCLCLAHWKAEVMIMLVLQNQNEGFRRASASTTSLDPSDVNGFQFQKPCQATPIPPASGVAPSSVAKCALKFSPGPKSPAALHTQKCSKDGMCSIFMNI